MNAVTVMLAVMEKNQKTMNVVPVMPVTMYQTISEHIMFQCHCWFLWQIWFFVLFGWCCNSKHICSNGFFEFINFNFYVITKIWHAHQKVRLDKLVWMKWDSEIFMGQIYWVIDETISKPILVTPIRFAAIFPSYVALSQSITSPPLSPLRTQTHTGGWFIHTAWVA